MLPMFQGSMMLKSLHTVITEDYGYSPYVSYALFALGTIVVGAALGMVSFISGENLT